MNTATDIIIIIAILTIPAIAQALISIRYKRYSGIENTQKLSGFETARKILDANGLNSIDIVTTAGTLSDHYDPRRKVVRLSDDVFNGNSIASMAVAAHECGHAIQDKNGYAFLRFRNTIVPLVNFSTKIGYLAIVLGIILSLAKLMYVGIAFEVIILLFQLVTLPVEFNASSRALKLIKEYGIVTEDEHSGAKKMLTSAALTYVAGVLSTLAEILRYILIFTGRDNR